MSALQTQPDTSELETVDQPALLLEAQTEGKKHLCFLDCKVQL